MTSSAANRRTSLSAILLGALLLLLLGGAVTVWALNRYPHVYQEAADAPDSPWRVPIWKLRHG